MNKIIIDNNHHLPTEINRALLLGDFDLTDDWMIIPTDEYRTLCEEFDSHANDVTITWDEYNELLNCRAAYLDDK